MSSSEEFIRCTYCLYFYSTENDRMWYPIVYNLSTTLEQLDIKMNSYLRFETKWNQLPWTCYRFKTL